MSATNVSKNYSFLYDSLLQYFQANAPDGACIAYSGGVDSTLLLKAAVDAAKKTGHSVLALIAETQFHPHTDTESARERAAALGADCDVLIIDEFQDPSLMNNPVDRCYLCKKLLFQEILDTAASKGYTAVFDGTNKDDERQYRPGKRALKELHIKSPLLELGLTKQQVRGLSAALGLPTATSPSMPCMATRLPYGETLNRDLLARIYQGETLLRSLGFYNVRLRYHDPVLRIETDPESFSRLLTMRTTLARRLKNLGFPYITLDLEGFRSGSMDLMLDEALQESS
ncbi:MAG TPA: ATP-dependent sacrificial sulfur transferase LarE [Candidatus Choladousia intestinavium]|uniref:ATP-dependent sacrificial sulfur transferase LarE n=1 Tax=Candidatus Choladousia intestinavium TaxID=2840727 RepID=A0A9D1ACG5_9FIRM|nr:ATP-dependent sacrificial sulfur transferase LarE [Candidatus Choladousia intestinavium]